MQTGAIHFLLLAIICNLETYHAASSYGTVKTLAGSISGREDGTGTYALFNEPRGMAISSGNTFMFVADTMNHKIRKVTFPTSSYTAGMYATNCTNGFLTSYSSTTAASCESYCLADTSCNGFVHSYNDECITSSLPSCLLDTTCTESVNITRCFYSYNGPAVETVAGGGDFGRTSGFFDSFGTSALLNMPYSIALTSNNLLMYVTEAGNNIVRKIDISNSYRVTHLAGGGRVGTFADIGDGTGTSAGFSFPTGMVLSSDDSTLYIADSANNKIRKLVVSSAEVTTILGGSGTDISGMSLDGTGTAMLLSLPMGIAMSVDATQLYISELGNHRLVKMTLET
ncbi:hypothetical protein CYMTET_20581, partial [Cymbomonas tetramitiformis]